MADVYMLLGKSGYEKLRNLNFLPMPCRKTMEVHVLEDPMVEEGIEASKKSLQNLDKVYFCHHILL